MWIYVIISLVTIACLVIAWIDERLERIKEEKGEEQMVEDIKEIIGENVLWEDNGTWLIEEGQEDKIAREIVKHLRRRR